MNDPDQGGNYASIDVDAYGDAVSDLESTHEGIGSKVISLEADFTFFRVDTSNLNKLKEAKTDLDDVLPGLRRRHSLALQLLAEQQAQGWAADGVVSFQGDILNDDFESMEAAQQAGSDAAGLVGENGEVPDEVYEQLEQYGHDPDFAEAFLNSLDPDTRALLLIETDNNREEDGGESNFQALSTTFATASFRIDYDAEFIEEMNQAMLDRDLHPAGIRMVDRMAAMMQNDTWSHESLLAFAETALADDNYDTIGQVDDWAAVINALARNPRASAEYINAHPEEVWDQSLVVGPVTSTEEWDEAWSRFVQAGTVDARSIYQRLALYDDSQENLAEENASFFITKVADQEEGKEFPFSENMRQTFYQMTQEYWDDMVYSYSSPAGVSDNPNRDGIEIPPEAWQKFLTEVMRSPDAAVDLNQDLSDWFASAWEDTMDTSNFTEHDYDRMALLGIMNGFAGAWDVVAQEFAEDEAAREEFLTKLAETGVDMAFNPTGAGTEAVKAALKAVMADFIEGQVENQAPDVDFDSPSNNELWVSSAVSGYNQSEDGVPPYDDGTVTWTGDPDFYTDLYGGESFVDEDGNVLHPDDEDFPDDPDTLRAFNEWCKDPAIQVWLSDVDMN